MGAFLLIVLGFVLFAALGILFTLESDPKRVDEREARRVGNRSS